MSWGIAETASEIEKIESESADYLSELNSCGVIDWGTYNYAFDFYADLLMEAYEQGRKDAQPEPCEDAVSREAVSEWLKQYGQDVLHGKYKFSLMYIWKNLMDLPSVQIKRKNGKWIDAVLPNDNGGLPVQVCDQCNTFFPLAYTGGGHRFCPSCGAKMEVEHE